MASTSKLFLIMNGLLRVAAAPAQQGPPVPAFVAADDSFGPAHIHCIERQGVGKPFVFNTSGRRR
jgi:hypothetical protein